MGFKDSGTATDGFWHRARSFQIGNMSKSFPANTVAWKYEWREIVNGEVVRSDSSTMLENPNVPHDWTRQPTTA